MATRAVIFDHSTLFGQIMAVNDALRQLLTTLKGASIGVIIFSTNHTKSEIDDLMHDHGFPPCDLFVNRALAGGNKGQKCWIDVVTDTFAIRPHDLLYVGDGKYDQLTALNSGVCYLSARWSQGDDNLTALIAPNPDYVAYFIDEFLWDGPLWEYRLDLPDKRVRMRSLLDRNSPIPCTNYPGIDLKQLLKGELIHSGDPALGEYHLRDILVLHALTSLYQEGVLTPGLLYTIYPGHKPATNNEILAAFMAWAPKVFKGYYFNDLLLREKDAPDTSWLRYTGGRAKFHHQTDTVIINDRYQNRLLKNGVVVFDDFTTEGFSLEWARNLFEAAGAPSVTVVTIGKYGNRYQVHSPTSETAVTPYTLRDYDVDQEFTVAVQYPTRDQTAADKLREKLEKWMGLPEFLPY